MIVNNRTQRYASDKNNNDRLDSQKHMTVGSALLPSRTSLRWLTPSLKAAHSSIDMHILPLPRIVGTGHIKQYSASLTPYLHQPLNNKCTSWRLHFLRIPRLGERGLEDVHGDGDVEVAEIGVGIFCLRFAWRGGCGGFGRGEGIAGDRDGREPGMLLRLVF